MRAPARLLHPTTTAASGEHSSSSPPRPPPPTEQQPVLSVDSDMVVILASLLCALVCVLGLALVSRCACRRRLAGSSSSSSPAPPPPKGLKKKAIDALPTVSFSATTCAPAATAAAAVSTECAICLAEFGEGEELRVLPRCGHEFHVACVDAWLRSRATCPSCRAGIAAPAPAPAPAAVEGTCGRCGVSCNDVAVVDSTTGGGGGGDDRFLP